jgi:NAD(P)-dependent dehydrogenase (short-subunit alcohol dehydrogenase family)
MSWRIFQNIGDKYTRSALRDARRIAQDQGAPFEASKQLPAKVTAIRSDSSGVQDVDALVTALQAKIDRLDVLFINAGIAKFLPFELYSQAIG